MKRIIFATATIIFIAVGVFSCRNWSIIENITKVDYSWIRGANYVPSYARNDVQLWMDFDSEIIDRELGYAKKLNLNTVRVFLQFAVYEKDPDKFMSNFETLLKLCKKHNIQLMPVIFDSCFGEFPDLKEYRNKDWMANPGQNKLGKEYWDVLDDYVRQLVGKYKDDSRIVMWDVMNEPYITSWAKADSGRQKIYTFIDAVKVAEHGS